MKEPRSKKLMEALETLLSWSKSLNFHSSTNKPIRKSKSTSSDFAYIRGRLRIPNHAHANFISTSSLL